MSQSKLLKKILSNSALLIVEKLLTMSLTLGITFFLTKSLSVEEWGVLSYLLAFSGLIIPLTAMGLNGLISQYLLKLPNQKSEVLGTAITIRLAGSILSAFTLYFIAKYWLIIEQETLSLLRILLIGTTTLAFTGINFYFESEMQIKFASLVRILAMLFAAIAKVWAVSTNQSLEILVTIFSLEFSFLAIFFIISYQFYAKDLPHWRWSNSIAKDLFQRCGWLIFSSVFAVIYLKIDQVMLGHYSTMTEVGQYALAAKLSEVWIFLPNALIASIYPTLVTLYKNNPEQYHLRLQQSSDGLFLLALFIAIAVQFGGVWFITNLFGEEYQTAAYILQIHIWSAIFIFLRSLASRWLIIEDVVKYSLYSHVSGAIINVLLNLVLIPSMGGKGAAIATLVSYIIAGWIIFFIHNDTKKIGVIMTKSLLLPCRLILTFIIKLKKP